VKTNYWLLYFPGGTEFPIAVKSRYLIQGPRCGREGRPCVTFFHRRRLTSRGIRWSVIISGDERNQGFELSKSNKNLESNQFGRG
jgi:hypothetical protein